MNGLEETRDNSDTSRRKTTFHETKVDVIVTDPIGMAKCDVSRCEPIIALSFITTSILKVLTPTLDSTP
jgi:hypothetical protein